MSVPKADPHWHPDLLYHYLVATKGKLDNTGSKYFDNWYRKAVKKVDASKTLKDITRLDMYQLLVGTKFADLPGHDCTARYGYRRYCTNESLIPWNMNNPVFKKKAGRLACGTSVLAFFRKFMKCEDSSVAFKVAPRSRWHADARDTWAFLLDVAIRAQLHNWIPVRVHVGKYGRGSHYVGIVAAHALRPREFLVVEPWCYNYQPFVTYNGNKTGFLGIISYDKRKHLWVYGSSYEVVSVEIPRAAWPKFPKNYNPATGKAA